MPDKPYNPLDYDNLTVNLVRALMARDPVRLPPSEIFAGPGVYALFYRGRFEPYLPISSAKCKIPIYVGKAVPPGSRKGGGGKDQTEPVLYRRLKQHTASLAAAENLEIADFWCRHLTVVPLWITMAERFLIEYYGPIWNVCIDGFGIHNPGKGRHAGEIPWWDALHPGRPWARKLRQVKTADTALGKINDFFRDWNPNEETP